MIEWIFLRISYRYIVFNKLKKKELYLANLTLVFPWLQLGPGVVYDAELVIDIFRDNLCEQKENKEDVYEKRQEKVST